MILHHIPQRAALVVIPRPIIRVHRLGDGDLHVIDIFVIPDRLEDRIGEAHHHQVLDGFFAEIMVDAVNLLFA